MQCFISQMKSRRQSDITRSNDFGFVQRPLRKTGCLKNGSRTFVMNDIGSFEALINKTIHNFDCDVNTGRMYVTQQCTQLKVKLKKV